MRIGIPKEQKNSENRVALPPAGVYDLVKAGHEVLVEAQAGAGSTISDDAYRSAGATIVQSAEEVWQADMVMKVKEPIPTEYQYFREGLILFTYLHLAANLELTNQLIASKVNAIAYENVQTETGALPLLAPMSEIAGRMAAQIGAQYLEKINDGKGILLSGVAGVKKGNVVVIGGGVAGTNAANLAFGLGANVTILDINLQRLKEIDRQFSGQIQTLMSNRYNIEEALKTADLAIGAVLIPGHKAPTLVTKEVVQSMPKRSVIVDIAIDQGGIFETANEVTTHDNPTYIKEDVIHYAVANMPGAVPQTATYALSNATLPYAKLLASAALPQVLRNYPALAKGVNTYEGKLTLSAVAEDLDMPYTNLAELI